jgi:hypothetical protein
VIAFIAWLELPDTTHQKAGAIIKAHERFEQDFVGKMPDSVAHGDEALKSQWLFLQAAVCPDLPRGFSGALR